MHTVINRIISGDYIIFLLLYSCLPFNIAGDPFTSAHTLTPTPLQDWNTSEPDATALPLLHEEVK